MKEFNKYMLFYTSLQLIGVVGIIEFDKWTKKNLKKK